MPPVLRVSIALFLVQAGFHGYTASIPVALARAGRPDAEIGAIVGVASLVQIPAALLAGVLIDRFGSVRLFVIGGVCYLFASALLLLPAAESGGSTIPLIAARVLQGAGFGMAVPSAMTVVPRLVSAARRGVALATVGGAHNLTLVVLPPLSIVVLDRFGLDGVSVLVGALVIAALALIVFRPLASLPAAEHHLDAAARRFGFAFRRSWVGPLAVTILFVLHWGVLTAYLPQRAEAAGASIGVFFAADGLFILLSRVPAGWLADRTAFIWPILAGIGMTALAVVLLLPPPTTPTLVVAGVLTGAGAALIVTPLLLALTQRSTDADRGSAFAIFSASLALAIAAGTIGTAPLIDSLGFQSLLIIALAALVLSAVVALADRDLRARGAGHRPGDADSDLSAEMATPIGP